MERPLPPLHRSLAFVVPAEHISRGQCTAAKVLRRLSGDFFICGGWYRMGTASVFPARFSIAFHRKVCFNKKSHTAIRRSEKVGAGCSKLRS